MQAVRLPQLLPRSPQLLWVLLFNAVEQLFMEVLLALLHVWVHLHPAFAAWHFPCLCPAWRAEQSVCRLPAPQACREMEMLLV